MPDEHAKRRGVSSFSFAHLFFSHTPFYSPLFIHKSWHLSEILRICFFVSNTCIPEDHSVLHIVLLFVRNKVYTVMLPF